jgi:hypothetical protein
MFCSPEIQLAYHNAVMGLLPQVEEREVECVHRAIEELRVREWSVAETASKLYWLEHVNPDIAEDVALAGMRAAEARVAAKRSQKG